MNETSKSEGTHPPPPSSSPPSKKSKIHPCEEEVESDDPGCVFIFNSDTDVHRVLGLPAVATLSPPLQQGQTPAQSCANLHSWLDSIACSLAGQQCLVKTIDGTREKGLYHHLKNEPHALFESELSGLATWFLQCLQINVSAGRYYCVESGGMGMGSLLMTQKKLGPFQ